MILQGTNKLLAEMRENHGTPEGILRISVLRALVIYTSHH